MKRKLKKSNFLYPTKITSTSSQLEQPRQEKVLSFANEQLEEQNKVVSMFDRKVEETENYITDYVEG